MISKLKSLHSRTAGALVLCAAWAYACGGSEFKAGGSGGAPATGGTSTSGAASTTGGTSAAGVSSGGSSEAGTAASGAAGVGEAGAAQGGTSEAGTSSGGAHGGAAGTGGAGGTGGVRNSGDCLVDKECGAGNSCVALFPSGFRTCVVPVPLATKCSATDACCPGVKECATGAVCVETPLGPSCGLAVRPTPVCATSGCTTAADCPGSNAICAPAGTLDRKANTCLTGGCRRDVECKDIAGGKCEPVTSNCCDAPAGLYCVYPGKGCRSSADCAAGSSCQIVNQKTGECVAGSGICAG